MEESNGVPTKVLTEEQLGVFITPALGLVIASLQDWVHKMGKEQEVLDILNEAAPIIRADKLMRGTSDCVIVQLFLDMLEHTRATEGAVPIMQILDKINQLQIQSSGKRNN